MNFVISFGLKLLTTTAAKKLVVVTLSELAKRTDNNVDDTVVEGVAEVLNVELKKETI